MSKAVFLLLVLVCALSAVAQEKNALNVTQGSLFARGKEGRLVGECPLKNTSVKTDISGFVARVRVRQEFENSLTEPIEAIYTFPLSQNGAVDDMTMTVGSRTIRGKILKREEARQVYEQAKTEGKTAGLLDQERPNIFTQSVANIMPGEKIIVEISYVETLKYEDGAYEFVFPMTVGPRYNPASVTDVAKITPPVALERPGHDISVEVNLNAGVPVEEIRSTSHDIQQTNFSPNVSQVVLRNGTTIPNKDFILRYDVTGGKIQDAVIAHRSERGGFFTMILQPPDKIAAEDRTPKEIVFVLDTSGSMFGFPIEKAKEAMRLSLEGLYPDDTFNFITFAGDTEVLFEKPVPATQTNLTRALEFLESRSGGGGTEMMKAIKVALDPSDASDHVRIVCFMTDGYVGNENEIIAEVQRHPRARVFSFGIGNSVNRFLLDKIAEAGRGEAEYVSLEDDGSKAARKFYERVRSPLLTDLSIDWNGLPVADVYPSKLTDLFSAKPVIVHGRYTKAMNGIIKLRGNVAGQPYVREIAVNFPAIELANDSLASLWARTRVDELSSEKLRVTDQAKSAQYDKQILDLGLQFRLLTNLTSFVAVEDRVVNQNGKPVTIQVPVGMADGVDPVMSGAKVAETVNVSGGGGGGIPMASSRSVQGLYTVSGASAQMSVVTKSGSKEKSPNPVGSNSTVVSGSGSGTGSGSGNGSGAALIPMAAQVVVTASEDEVVKVESHEPVRLTSNITAQQVQSLPAHGGDPTVAGSSGPENSFILDGIDGKSSGRFARGILIVQPEYPEAARAAGELGEVKVDVEVDPKGNVILARAVSGPEVLRPTSESAAKLSTFAPATQNGRAVRMKGTIEYKFTSKQGAVEIFLREMRVAPPTADDKRAARLQDVMHFWLYETLSRLDKGIAQPTANESKFVRDGKASVRIELTRDASTLRDKLSGAGVEIDTVKGSVVKGRVPLEKLANVATISEVKYVTPAL